MARLIRALAAGVVAAAAAACGDAREHAETVPVPPAPSPPGLVETLEPPPLPESNAPGRVPAADGLRARMLAVVRSTWHAETGADIPDRALASIADELEQALLHDAQRLTSDHAHFNGPTAEASRTAAVELLDAIDGSRPAPLLALVRDEAALAKLVARTTPETEVDGLAVARGDVATLADGATLRFAAGVHDVSDLTRYWERFPRDVTLAGAGMDETLLVLDTLRPRVPVVGLVLRDCTLLPRDAILLRSHATVTLRLERVRVVGLDGGKLLHADRAFLTASGCELLGGFGERFPAGGRLFEIGTARFVARIENTLVDGLSVVSGGLPSGATVLYEDCRLRNLLGAVDPLAYAELKAGVAFEACTLHRFQGVSREVLGRDLDDLFPRWRSRLDE